MKNNITTRLSSITRQLPGLLMVIAMASLITGNAQATDPVSVSFTLEGCNTTVPGFTPGSYNPDASPPDLICGDGITDDGGYTTGNLGKGWNELDLVPHRVTTNAGNSAPLSQTYTINIVADHEDVGNPGYDIISEPVLNLDKSDSSCAVLIGPEVVLDPGVGGTDKSLARSLTITQDQNTICVFDYVERLALGSHLYPGASLHSNLLNEIYDTGGVGNKDVSIPVKDILPQELAKDMSAKQDQEISWNITKEASPADIYFGDTCLVNEPADQAVNLTIEWYVQQITLDKIMVTTNVYATNPSQRKVTVNVTDVIYGTTGGVESELNTLNSGDVVVPPGENQLVLTHTFDADVGTTGLRDVATATYTDSIFPDVEIPGQSTAEASAEIELGTTTSADVFMTDTETLSGSAFSYAAEVSSSTTGTGAPLGGAWQDADPASGVWTSDPTSYLDCPDELNACEVVFTKTVSVVDPPVIADELLEDIAELDSTDGIFHQETEKSVDLSVDATVSLAIEKTIPDILQGDETASFTFNVCPTLGDGLACIDDAPVETVVFEFIAGETSHTENVTGLSPGTYLVSEVPPGSDSGWGTVPDQYADLSLPICSDSLIFENLLEAGPAEAAAAKVTIPGGATSWDVTLEGTTLGGVNVSETITFTANTGYALFTTVLEEGSYTIREIEQTDWYLTDVVTGPGEGPVAVPAPPGDTCEFTVNYPGNTGDVFDCQFTNVNPDITLTKSCDDLSKVGDDVDYTITLSNTVAGSPDLSCLINDSLLDIVDAPATVGSPHVINTSRTVLDGDPDPLVNNVSASCSIEGVTGTINDVASASASCDTDLFEPAFSVTKTGDAQGKVGDVVNYTITLTNGSGPGTPELTCTASDSLLGEIFNGVLPTGDTVLTPTYTVLAGDSDPLVNEVTLSCALPEGFTNILDDVSDTHSVDLFEPAFSVTKTGDAQGKVGDIVNYTITLTNGSGPGTPELTCTANDSLLGEIFNDVLPTGDTVLTPTYTVLAGDSDPLANVVTLSCALPAGFTNILDDVSASHSTDLFEPAFSVTKTGDAQGKVGDVVNYTITLTNGSGPGTPELTCTASDSLLGEIFNGVLPTGDTVLTPTYTVLAGDSDPLVNEVTLSCALPEGFTNILDDVSDTHSVDLFEPAFSVTKTGDAQGKVGDIVNYTITLTNGSGPGTPELTCTANDSLLGEIFNDVLPTGDTVLTPTYTVLAGDSDPLANVVTLSCALPAGFTNILDDVSASHSTDLFEPAFSVTKTGDAQGKVGDVVNYTITLTNGSGPGTPELTCTASDSLLGEIFNGVLPTGDTVLTPTYTVLAGDSDPLVNEVTLSCALPEGFTNILDDVSDTHSVDLFEPAFSVTKTGDAQGKVGDIVNYTITLTNGSGPGTPELTCTANDSLLGEIFNDVLPTGDTVLTPTYTVLAGDSDPLANVVTLSCALPAGFTNILDDVSASHSTDLFEPAFSVTKTGDAQGKVGDVVNYTITLTNGSGPGTPELTCTASDSLLGEIFNGVLPTGDTVLTPTYTVLAGDSDPLVNEVTLSCALPEGFTNILDDVSDTHSVDLFEPAFSVTKTGDAQGKVGDIVNYTITLTNGSGPGTPELTCTANDSLLGEIFNDVLPTGDTVLTPTYTVLAGDSDPLANVVTLSCALPAGFTNILDDVSASHSTDLFEPAFSVTKTGDAQGKVGDVVNYTITLTNGSGPGTPELTCTASDSLLGEIFNGVLPTGDTVLTPTYTVLAGDSDPLVNEVTLSCALPEGFTNILDDVSDTHSVDLFEPAFSVTKTGDAQGKVGDIVNYTITLTNGSGPGTPELTCTANDSLLGEIFNDVLPTGDTVLTPTYTVLAGDSDPLANVVTLSCALPAGFTNILDDVSASHSTDLFEPAFSVTKTGDAQGKVGDVVNYTITLTNGSGPGTPELTCTASDSLLGEIFNGVLPTGDTVLTPTYTVLAGDSDPLVNEVTLSCALPEGFTNILDDVSDTHSVDLFEPAFSVTKTGDAQGKVGDIVNYTITLTNGSGPGTPELTCTANDSLLGEIFNDVLPTGDTVLTPTYTVLAGDSDPLANVVTLSCALPAGFTNILDDVSASHSTDLFEPAFSVTKTGDAQGKVGDVVNYTITLTNGSGPGTPELTCTASDSLLGEIFNGVLPTGDTVLTPTYTVLAGDSDPLVNEVTLSCALPEGFTNILDDVSDTHSVDLFEPAFSVTKTGDAQGKVGDIVNYTITLTNGSGPGTPELTCTANDSLLGEIFNDVLPTGDTVLTPTYTVLAGDSDPLANVVTLSCALPAGFTNILDDVSASHSTDLFEPAFSVTKTGDAQGKVGDVVNYTITLTNGSGPGTPELTCTASDSLLGEIFNGVLPTGDTVLTPTYTVLAGDSDPLVNEVTLSCALPEGFTNILDDVSDTHSVDLFEPAFSVTKTGDAQGKVGDIVNYTITLTNGSGPGTPELTCTANDSLLGEIFNDVLPTGDTVLTPTYTVLAGDSDPLANVVTLSCALPAGFTNILDDVSASHSTDLFEPAFSVTKTGDAQGKVGDVVNYTITLTNGSGPGTPELTCTASDSLLGEIFNGVLPTGDTVLTPTYTVLAGDSDPLVNEVTLSCALPEGFTNILDDVSDTHSVDLFEPAFSVTKTGDAQGKVGDIVNYTITLTNGSGPGTPELTCTANDSLLGEIFNDVLPTGDTVLTPTYTVLAGDSDPLANVVTLSCALPAGFTNILDDVSASHSTDLFEPAFSVTKTGDAQGKVGDVVNYTITLTNGSGPGTPELTCTASDSLLGEIFNGVLPTGDTVLTPTYTVLAGDSDPLVNEVTLSCALPEGFTNILDDVSDTHSVDLFEPAFSVTKTGDAQGKVGDIVNYTITLTNGSGPGTPELTCTANDSLLGEIFNDVLPTGDTVLTPTYTVLAGDSDPLANVVTLSCALPAGFTNILDDVSASHSTDLFEPAFSVTKTGDAQGKVGDVVNYTITLTNGSGPGTPELTCTASDSLLGEIFNGVLPTGDTVLTPTYTVLAGDSDPLVNEVTLSCALPEGFTNILDDVSDTHSVDLFEPAFSVTKTGDAQGKVGDIVNYTITLTNGSGPGTPELTCTANDSLLGEIFNDVLPTGDTVLTPTYTVLAGDSDPLANVVTLSCALPAGFTNILDDVSASHSTDLFEPAFSVTKTGDAQGKVGDVVNYTITLTNGSGPGTPELTCTASDSLLGEIFNGVLPTGDTVLTPTYTVLAGDSDPLVNEVTLSCALPEGFTNILDDVSDTHSVDLFEPAFSVTKTGDAQGKVGDIVNYTITLTNGSGPGTPELTCTANDSLLGEIFNDVLPTGDTVLTPTYTVLAGDSDPLANVVTLSCALPAGFTNILDDVSASHSTDLFEPAFSVTKTGDAQGKVGDVVNYTITLTNGSGPGTPELTCTASDSLLGEIFNGVLPTGDTVLTPTYTVLAGDSDPLVNEVTLSCALPEGFTNILDDVSDTHSVDLFEPAFSVTKTGDAQGKVGDIVNYTITLTNGSGPGTPELTCTANDSLLGEIFNDVLPTGDTVLTPTYTVLAGDSDPLANVVTLSCALPAGFTNILDDVSASHSTDLFEPAFSVTNTAGGTSKVGDAVDYTITLTNGSSANTPPLICTASDSLLGVIFGPDGVLPLGDMVINRSRTVLESDPDTLDNVVTLSCALPSGFTNVLNAATATHSVELFHPSFTVVKSCTNEPVPQEGPATWDIVVTNTGDVALNITVTDDLLPGGPAVVSLAAGGFTTLKVEDSGTGDDPFSGWSTVSNTVNATAVIDPTLGVFTNEITPDESTAVCNVGSRVNLLKRSGPNGAAVVDPTSSWTFSIWEGVDGFGGTLVASDNTNGDVDGLLDFDLANLDWAQAYTLCEQEVPAGYSVFWQVYNETTGVWDTVLPYNPNADEDPPEDLGNRCIDIGSGTGFLLTAGDTLQFRVDNTYPGGEPRTPGYWKNWNTCTGGGQQYTAAANGGYLNGFWLLEDVLDPDIGGGIWWDDILDDGHNPDPAYTSPIESCEVAVDILDQREIGDPDVVGDGSKHSSDAAYTLAMHLLAAQLNFGAGAADCDAVRDAALAGEELLDKLDFNGTGDYLSSGDPDYPYALDLANQIDLYNNGELCTGPAVSFTSPNENDVVNGEILISVDVLDLFVVTQVEFFIDGTSIGTDSVGSDVWTLSWDSTTVPEGSHTLQAVATNDNPAGAETGSANINILVYTVSITSPADGDIVGLQVDPPATSVDITADAADGVTQVEFAVDGSVIGTDTDGTDGWSATWDLTGVADGDYSITAMASDGSLTGSDSVTVTVDNEAPVPDVPLTVELTGSSSWKNKVKWNATATIMVTNDPVVEGALVSGSWDGGSTGSCTTDAIGACAITLSSISKKVGSVTFTVETITATGYTYTPADSVVINRP